jgi:dihydroorotase
MYGARLKGNRRFDCELTLKDGKVVYDLNGITRPDWTTLPKDYRQTGGARWDAVSPGRGGRGQGGGRGRGGNTPIGQQATPVGR